MQDGRNTSYHLDSFTARVNESAFKWRAERGYTNSPYPRRAQDNGWLRGPLHGVITYPFCPTLILYEEVLVDIFTISFKLFGSGVRGLHIWPFNLIQMLINCNMVSPMYRTPMLYELQWHFQKLTVVNVLQALHSCFTSKSNVWKDLHW